MPTDDSSPTLSLAANKVGSSEDLVTEIVLRLPVTSLIMFKSVSKHWYSLITNNPCFKNPYKPPDPPSGLFVRTLSGYVFVPFNIHNPVKFPTLNHVYPLKGIQFKHSCNGLILCGNQKVLDDNKLVTDESYVYNPTINQIIRLPIPGIRKHVFGMSIAFNPLKSPHYKVIYVVGDIDGYEIHMYSSQTRTCKFSCNLTRTRVSKMMFTTGVHWNNNIHWVDMVGYIVYFDLDREMSYEIEAPFARSGLDYKDYLCYIFESRDRLLLVEIFRPLITKFKLYELKGDYSDWLLKFHVDIKEFGGLLFPKSVNMLLNHYIQFDVLSLVLGSEDDESFLLVEIFDKIMRLNIESKTYHELSEIYDRCSKYWRPISFLWPKVYQFAASLYNLQYEEGVDIACHGSMKLPWKLKYC